MQASSRYQDGRYLVANPTWHEEDSAWKATQISRMIRQNNLRPATICEIGCGAGEILNCLSKEFDNPTEFFGYEISPQAFEICKAKEHPKLKFNLVNLLEDPSHFDIAMAIDVFEHVEDYFGFLRKFKSKGTYKIFHIPLDLSVQTVLRSRPILHGRETNGHIHYFTKETALATLSDTGYEVMDYFYTNSAIELTDRGWKSELMKAPRSLMFALNQDLAARLLGGFSLLVLAK